MSECPLDEAKTLYVFGLKTKIVAPATLPSRWLQQSTPLVETHIINTHADGPSQFDESERPRSHISPRTRKRAARTGQAHHSPLGKRILESARGSQRNSTDPFRSVRRGGLRARAVSSTCGAIRNLGVGTLGADAVNQVQERRRALERARRAPVTAHSSVRPPRISIASRCSRTRRGRGSSRACIEESMGPPRPCSSRSG